MSPEERQLLSDLFDRVRSQANAPRDRDAENLIADAVRAQPYAPYLLAQAVLVQEQALHGADQKIQELQAHIDQLEAEVGQLQPQAAAAPQSWQLPRRPVRRRRAASSRSGPQSAVPTLGAAAPQQPAYAPPPQQPEPAPSPWGAPQQPQGGGFLKNAMGAAAGVAGGVLLADSLRGLFGGGHNAGSSLGGSASAPDLAELALAAEPGLAGQALAAARRS